MNVYESIKNSLIKAVKQVYPKHRIFAEDIKKLNNEIEKNHISDYVYITLYSVNNRYLGMEVDRTILVAITVHDFAETIAQYHNEALMLERVLYPVFHFDDRFVTAEDSEATVVGGTLNFTFHLTFREMINGEEEETSYLEELTIKEKKG